MDQVLEVAKPRTRRWVYSSGALLALVLVIIAGVVLLPVVKEVPGMATANPQAVIAYATEVKAADEAAAAKKAADDAAAFLVTLAAAVKVDMQRYVDNPDNNLTSPHITVFDVNLIKVGDNKYEGMADMQAGNGPRRQIIVHVLADGQNTEWSTDKGGLLPLFNN